MPTKIETPTVSKYDRLARERNPELAAAYQLVDEHIQPLHADGISLDRILELSQTSHGDRIVAIVRMNVLVRCTLSRAGKHLVMQKGKEIRNALTTAGVGSTTTERSEAIRYWYIEENPRLGPPELLDKLFAERFKSILDEAGMEVMQCDQIKLVGLDV